MDSEDKSKSTILTVLCIDKRYNYYLLTTAGSALCLGYEQYCSTICNSGCHCAHENNVNPTKCDPENKDMKLLKQ